jgi:hypothetical protein
MSGTTKTSGSMKGAARLPDVDHRDALGQGTAHLDAQPGAAPAHHDGAVLQDLRVVSGQQIGGRADRAEPLRRQRAVRVKSEWVRLRDAEEAVLPRLGQPAVAPDDGGVRS